MRPPVYPLVTLFTPRISAYTASVHQKQPPPKVAVATAEGSPALIRSVIKTPDIHVITSQARSGLTKKP